MAGRGPLTLHWDKRKLRLGWRDCLEAQPDELASFKLPSQTKTSPIKRKFCLGLKPFVAAPLIGRKGVLDAPPSNTNNRTRPHLGAWALPWARSLVLFTSLSLSHPMRLAAGLDPLFLLMRCTEKNHPQDRIRGCSPPKVINPR